jgi:hypothetical protein
MERVHSGGIERHYFHRSSTKEIWAVRELPDVTEISENRTKSRKNPRRLSWHANAVTEHIAATNWIRPDNNQWHEMVQIHINQTYPATYQLEEVRGLVKSHYLAKPEGDDVVEITAAEYQRLEELYTAAGRQNPPPVPLPPYRH